MIETRLLRYFLVVAQERNITNAAKALHITQPTLSRQMSLLEDELGTKLFVRDSRPLALTDEGLLLKRRAEDILELVAKTEAELSSHDEQVEGVVSIGCGESASVRMLVGMMADFAARHAGVSFDVYTANADQIKQRIDNGLTDIGLLLEPVDMERYEYVRIPVVERWVAVMPSEAPLARNERVTASELAQSPIIMPSRPRIHDEVANWFGSCYGDVKITAASNLSTNAALMVRAGMGYALVIEGALPFLDSAQVCVRPLEPELNATSVLAWRRGQPFSNAVLRFLEHIKCSLGMEHR